MEQNYLKFWFSYTDEYGQESELNKTLSTISLEEENELSLLLSQFKLFLISAGFSELQVDKISLEKDN